MRPRHFVTPLLLVLLAVAVSLIVLAPGAGAEHAHPEGKHEVADDSPPSPAVVAGAGCTDGSAGAFACSHVELVAWVTRGSLGLGQINDVWGWTDPLTGSEYAILGTRNAVAFVDLSDPRDPIHVGSLPTQSSPSIWNDMKVYGDFAFIVSEAPGHGMQVFDLTLLATVTAPPETFAPAATYGGFSRAHNIAIDEETGYAYAVGTNTCAGGLHIIDIADPLAPEFAGCYAGDGYTHDVQCTVYTGPDVEHRDREICFAANEDTLTIVDVSDPVVPVPLSRTGYTGRGYTHQGWLTEDQGYFLVDDEFDERITGRRTQTYVWDVSDLDAPVVTGVHTGTTRAIDHNQYVVGDHVFQANYRSGLRILRTGNLAEAELAEVAFFDTYPQNDFPSFSGAWGVYPFFESGIVVVSDINRGLFILRPDLLAVPRCDDGLDNDGDGLVDHPEDPACLGPEGETESPRNDVSVDIRPDSDQNPINPASQGVIPVAIFGNGDFDVDEVAASTLRFGPGEASPAHKKNAHHDDLDGDGSTDLVSHFRTQQTGIAYGDWSACLSFELLDGTRYQGCDFVNTRPGCGLGFELVLIALLASWRHRRKAQ